MRRNFLIGAILFVISIAVFAPVYNAEFIHWDDDLNITGNPHIQKLNAENLKWMFTDFSFMRRYVPMSWLTWGTTAHFFGLNPRAFHIEGLLLHAINTVLVFLLLQKLLRLAQKSPNDTRITIGSALGALIWAVHPLRVEVVAWANCQMYAQSLLLLLGSTFAYLRAINGAGGKIKFLILSTLLFLLSLLTYPTGIAFVAILLVIDIFVLSRLPGNPLLWIGKESRTVLFEKLPFVISTLVVAGVTLWARSHLTEFWKAGDQISEFGWPSRIAQAFYMWAYYVWKPWFSFEWSPVYTQLVNFRPTQWPFVLSTVGVIAATLFLFLKRKRWPWASALWLCHLALLVPMLGLTEHPHYPNDRYNYIAAIVWSVLIALAVQHVAGKGKQIILVAVVIAATGFSVFSFQQTKVWTNSVALFEGILQRLGNDPFSGNIYWRLGNTFADKGEFPRAIDNFKKALAIDPSSAAVHVSLAESYLGQGDTNAAIIEYETAVKSAPQHSLAQYNLGVLLDQQGKTSEAIPHLRLAIEANPQNLDAYNTLARDLGRTGQINEAMEILSKSLQLDPGNPTANFNLGHALLSQNKLPEALEHFARAVKSKPEFAEAHYQLGTCLAMTGRVADGLTEFIEAARLNPHSPECFLAVGMASAQTGRFSSAISAYREAIRLNPDFMRALMNLGWILASHQDASLRNGPEALALAQRAVSLTQEKDFESLDLLAASYAECKKFPEAAASVSKAISLANANGQPTRATQLEARLELYRSERPLRQ